MTVLTHPDVLRQAAAAVAAVIEREALLPAKTIIVVPALSGIALACAVSITLMTEGYIIDRGKEKTYGSLKRFDGLFGDATHCLIVDDLIYSGKTILHTAAALRAMDKTVAHALVWRNTGHAGEQALRQAGIRLHWVESW